MRRPDLNSTGCLCSKAACQRPYSPSVQSFGVKGRRAHFGVSPPTQHSTSQQPGRGRAVPQHLPNSVSAEAFHMAPNTRLLPKPKKRDPNISGPKTLGTTGVAFDPMNRPRYSVPLSGPLPCCSRK